MNTGKLIKSKRKEHGFSQLELSKIIQVSQANISKYENDNLEIPTKHWLKLCALFDLNPFIYLPAKRPGQDEAA